MAFKSRDLCVLAYANGFTLWHYTSEDSEAIVYAPGYFNDASDSIRTGDNIHVNTGSPGKRTSTLLACAMSSVGGVQMDKLTPYLD